jgi:hypothetical protein
MATRIVQAIGRSQPYVKVLPLPRTSNRRPSATDVDFPQGQLWIDESTSPPQVYTHTGGGVWVQSGGTPIGAETFVTDSGTSLESGGVLNILGGNGIATTGSGNTVTIGLEIPVTVPNGGTGDVSLTDGGIVLGSGTDPVTVTAQPTDGQLLIGSTGLDPVLSTLSSADGSVTFTPGPGSLDLTVPATGTNTFNTDSTPAQEVAGAIDILGGTGVTTSGAGSAVTIDLDVPVTVPLGGTGDTSLTDGGIMLGSGTDPVTVTAQPTDGQLLMGVTGSDPVLNTLSSSDGSVTFNPGPGSLDLSVPATGTNTFNADTGQAVESAGAISVLGGTGLSTSGSGSSLTIDLDVPVTVPLGGTGATTLTDGGIVLGSGTDPVTVTAQPTDGQLLMGVTGSDPVLNELTSSDSSVTITNGAGTVDLTLASTPFNSLTGLPSNDVKVLEPTPGNYVLELGTKDTDSPNNMVCNREADPGVNHGDQVTLFGVKSGVGQCTDSTAIGYGAAENGNLTNCTAVGNESLKNISNVVISESVAVGFNALSNPSVDIQKSTAVGHLASSFNPGKYVTSVGFEAGQTNQSDSTVSVGYQAGKTSQGLESVAVGYLAGSNTQGASSVAIGNEAGGKLQSLNCVAIGKGSGFDTQKQESIAIGTAAGGLRQNDFAVAIGSTSGFEDQGTEAIAIGNGAGFKTQSNYGIAIGSLSGNQGQSTQAIAIGLNAGNDFQGEKSVAIGGNAGVTTQGNFSIAIGDLAGNNTQGAKSVAIGNNAGEKIQGGTAVAIGNGAAFENQKESAVAIGNDAGYTGQGTTSVAIGPISGYTLQGDAAVAIGSSAGNDTQGADAIAIGSLAGTTTQQTKAIAIGSEAGKTTQSNFSIAIGRNAGETTQGELSVAIGDYAGNDTQGKDSVAIGNKAAQKIQGATAVAIGNGAAFENQKDSAVAIGSGAGSTGQGISSVAIGPISGFTLQGDAAVAIGSGAGNDTQGKEAIAIGLNSGVSNQSQYAIAMGTDAGKLSQGGYAIAIGNTAGKNTQGDHAIAIGRQAQEFCTDNGSSISIGYQASRSSTAPDDITIGREAGWTGLSGKSVVIGGRACRNEDMTGVPTTTGDHAIVIGYQAGFPAGVAQNVPPYSILLGSNCPAPTTARFCLHSLEAVEPTASAGGAAIPAQAQAFMLIQLNGADYKIPLFNP